MTARSDYGILRTLGYEGFTEKILRAAPDTCRLPASS